MIKKNKAAIVLELLGQGYSAQEIKNRVAVSASYVYMIKKQLAEGIFTPEELGVSEETFIEVALAASQGKGKPKPGEFIVVEGAKNAQEVDAILNTRATTYGSFEGVAEIAQELKALIHERITDSHKVLDADQIEAFDMIASKIARILNGDPNHLDSWIDIAGYATLVVDRLQGKAR
jgi:hypothetical protein